MESACSGLGNAWFARIVGERATPPAPVAARGRDGERRQDWGEAPGVGDFVGRTEDLRTLRGWVLDERSRLVAILGMGGIGKTSLAARLAQEVAPNLRAHLLAQLARCITRRRVACRRACGLSGSGC